MTNIRLEYLWYKHSFKAKLWQWIAFKLPPKLIYHAAIRAGGYATTGDYSADCPDDVTIIQVIERWEKGHRSKGT